MTESAVAPMAPYRVAAAQGEQHFWCAWGRSAVPPLHGGLRKDAGLVPVPWLTAEDRVACLCGCRRTSGAPLCDGSHKQI